MAIVQSNNVLTQDRPQDLLHTMKIVLRPTPSLQYARHDAHSVSATHSGHTALARTISTCCKQQILCAASLQHTMDHSLCNTQWTYCRPHYLNSTQWTQCRSCCLQHTVDTTQTHNIYTAHSGHNADPQHLYNTEWTQCRPTTSIQHRMDTVQTHNIYTTQNGHSADPQHLDNTEWTQCRPRCLQHTMETMQTHNISAAHNGIVQTHTISTAHNRHSADPHHLYSTQST